MRVEGKKLFWFVAVPTAVAVAPYQVIPGWLRITSGAIAVLGAVGVVIGVWAAAFESSLQNFSSKNQETTQQ